MKVKATKPGYFGKLRDVGDEFEVPEGVSGSWFKPEQDDEEAPKRKPGRPPKSAE